MPCRGVRGATTVQEDSREAILEATRDLLTQMAQANGIAPQDVASVFFTATPDLTAEYPALAARQLGWTDAALLCAQEMKVPHGLPRCIRVLIHWNTETPPDRIIHVYIRGAEVLRPDWAGVPVPEGGAP